MAAARVMRSEVQTRFFEPTLKTGAVESVQRSFPFQDRGSFENDGSGVETVGCVFRRFVHDAQGL
jgi:hypothetical protein